jgi:hypothetical protein
VASACVRIVADDPAIEWNMKGRISVFLKISHRALAFRNEVL